MKIDDRVFYTAFGIVLVIGVLASGLKPFPVRLNQGPDTSSNILKTAPENSLLSHQWH